MKIAEQLLKQALKARENAYAPYSHYSVGAAIYTQSGKIYSSCNVENISFPCGVCAEAGAISAMIAGGDTKIKTILVVSDGDNLVYPCGACLQRIAEFADEKTEICLADTQKIHKTYTLKELLPHCFKENI